MVQTVIVRKGVFTPLNFTLKIISPLPPNLSISSTTSNTLNKLHPSSSRQLTASASEVEHEAAHSRRLVVTFIG